MVPLLPPHSLDRRLPPHSRHGCVLYHPGNGDEGEGCGRRKFLRGKSGDVWMLISDELATKRFRPTIVKVKSHLTPEEHSPWKYPFGRCFSMRRQTMLRAKQAITKDFGRMR